MRPTLLLLALLSVSGAADASWFSQDKPAYESWSTDDMKAWLDSHTIPYPNSPSQADLSSLVKAHWEHATDTTFPAATQWTADQLTKAQVAFQDLRDSSFDAWDESRLREFLLEQGVVAPRGTREQLVLLAKQKYWSYSSAVSSASKTASTAIYGDATQQASKSVTSAYGKASKSASSLGNEASKTASLAASLASSAVVAATTAVTRAPDDFKDYVYSTWDDNRLRSYLESNGYIKTKEQKNREELLGMMRNAYTRVANPVWDAWSDSYIHEWLLTHGIISRPPSYSEKVAEKVPSRDQLNQRMKEYYYDTSDTIYSTWTDSQMKQWLVDNGYIKSDTQVTRDKALKMLQDHYTSAHDTIWSSWSESDMRAWLINHGYLRSDAQVKRDELLASMQSHYHTFSARAAPYLAWPDARLRAFIRSANVDSAKDDARLSRMNREELLREVRVRWAQGKGGVEGVLERVREWVESGVEGVEERIGRVLEVLGGWGEDSSKTVKGKGEGMKQEL